MKSRAIILYWLLLLVPTLGAGLFMLQLLRNEGERLALTESAALQGKARVMADEIALSIEEAKDGLIAALREIPADDSGGSLRDWERENPLIRNVFVWNTAQKRLVFPSEQNGLTGEQAGFVRRYDDLFAGRAPWPAAVAVDDRQQLASARQQIRALTKADYAINKKMAMAQSQMPDQEITQPSPGPDNGWLAWYWQDKLHLLGWLRSADGLRVSGVEIEMAALLSRIAAGFSGRPANGYVNAIIDGNGHVFAQRGGTEITRDMTPRVTVSLSPQLPHWQVAIFGTPPAAAARSFALVSALLVGVFVIAILSGGSLLLWQARRNLLEAQQRTSFVSNVSHELKTPLTTIRMYSEMLADGRVPTDEKRRGYLDVITRESQRLTRLVNNVLDFSRLEQGRKRYQSERLDIADVAHEVLESQADRLREAGMNLSTEFPDEPAYARLDRDAFSQCLLNLVDNAIKYASGGGKLAVRLWRDSVPPAATGPSLEGGTPPLHAWRLAIEDAGPGIPSACREKLFQQFHRADDSLTAKVAGFGLGLSISRRLLRDQGGNLFFEPADSGGARFVMVLPGDGS